MHGLLTSDDASVFLCTSRKNTEPTDYYVHHPRHSIIVKNKCKQVGVECMMLLRAEDPSLNRNVIREKMLAFFFKHLKVSN